MLIREYRADDASQIVEVYRDACNTLRKSKGGIHPDSVIDSWFEKSDKEIHSELIRNCALFVAEVEETGEIAGIGGIKITWLDKLINSVHSHNNFVKEKFQRGRSGFNVGSMLRKAAIEKAKVMGFRKMYASSTPEAVGFHKRCGAQFFPQHNTVSRAGTEYHYYEIELRPSRWNNLRIEPYCIWINGIIHKLRKLPQKLLHIAGINSKQPAGSKTCSKR